MDEPPVISIVGAEMTPPVLEAAVEESELTITVAPVTVAYDSAVPFSEADSGRPIAGIANSGGDQRPRATARAETGMAPSPRTALKYRFCLCSAVTSIYPGGNALPA